MLVSRPFYGNVTRSNTFLTCKLEYPSNKGVVNLLDSIILFDIIKGIQDVKAIQFYSDNRPNEKAMP